MREDHNIQILGQVNTIQLSLSGVWEIAPSDKGVKILSTDKNQTVIEFSASMESRSMQSWIQASEPLNAGW
jgi:hypothetical protein